MAVATYSDSEEENVPLSKRKAAPESNDIDEDVPLSQRSRNGKRPSYKDDSSDDDEVKSLKKRAVQTNGKVAAMKIKTENGQKKETVKKETAKKKTVGKEIGKKTPVKKESGKKETVRKESGKKIPVKKETVKKTPVKKESVKKESVKKEPQERESSAEGDDEEVYKWWEEGENDGSVKWYSLEHNGVMFPPEYVPLPKHVRLYYDRTPVELHPDAEEVAGFFGAMLNTDHALNPTFQKNFFEDFIECVKRTGGATTPDGTKIKIVDFARCDFTKIFDHYEKQRAEKRALSSAEKKQIKREKDALEEKYKTCLLDGRKQPVGNFRIEPPGLFRGRGAHPKTGKLKARVKPEQVTINIGKDCPIPQPPDGHSWAEVRHDNTVSWLAMWRENINGAFKYVFLAQSSALKGMSDFKKFEKARELKNHVEAIRRDYRRELKDKVMVNRQRATAMYLIDVLALRAGGEKGEDEADTVGCCSLRYEHVTLQPPRTLVFDFLGKDSIRYHQEVEVDQAVFENIKIFKRAPKTVGDDIFDRLDPPLLNKHLQNYMPGLTAKVFRTYNASHTMQQQLDLIPNKGSVHEKVVAFNAANRAVAILCNHQRTVSKNHEQSVGKIEDKIMELKWQRLRTKKMILEVDPKLKEKDPQYFADVDALDKDTIQGIQEKIIEREKDRIEKKFLRDNEKLKSEGEKPLPESDLKEKLKALKVMEAEFKAELKSGKPAVKSSATVEKLQAQVNKYDERIMTTELQLKDKEDNSQVALGTSKMNYIDPRLTVMFSKKYDVPIEKLFTKTLREKFAWAIHSADENWKF